MIKKKQQTDSSRAQLKKYVFVLSSAVTLIGRAAADTLASFGFEYSSTAGTTGMMSGTLTPSSGAGTASGFHTVSSTYSFPTGNGSTRSFSSNTWTVGDYYEFDVDATGYMNLALSFDMARSGTGAPNFTLQATVAGSTTFTLITAFSVYAPTTTGTSTITSGTNSGATTTASGVASFASGASNTAFNISVDLSTIPGLSNASDIFRIVAASAPSGTSGTDRVDNFVLTGAAVPEPSALALFSVAGLGAAIAAHRRKKA